MTPSIEQELEEKCPFERDSWGHEIWNKGFNDGFSLAMRKAQVLVEALLEHGPKENSRDSHNYGCPMRAPEESLIVECRCWQKQALEKFKERTGNGNR